ncbi:hypothetical protein [Vibrio mangrovi]|uniref:Uncharacterized protein n=1 Tax=Vibrio mangrovi TaxID=474394 RepID=A0ABU4I571_9VIBR|nr:hypothetical protein [Vibrio mangrovi]MDW6001747.1 hypothetical protein [Vibrio mangrovi]
MMGFLLYIDVISPGSFKLGAMSRLVSGNKVAVSQAFYYHSVLNRLNVFEPLWLLHMGWIRE